METSKLTATQKELCTVQIEKTGHVGCTPGGVLAKELGEATPGAKSSETGVWSASFSADGEQNVTQKLALTVKGTASKEFLETTAKKAKVETESKGEAQVSVTVPGGHQAETIGVVSYPIPLNPHYKVTAVYRNEAQTNEPEAPCLGSAEEPGAEPGFLCIYSGEAFGEKESEWENAEFFGFQSPGGRTTSGLESKGGILGESIVFRSKEFNEEAPILHIKAQAYLNTGGSWAVTSPEKETH